MHAFFVSIVYMANLFTQRVWELGISITPGRVTTYGAIAKAAGGGGQAARSVSSILGKYPNQGVIPWLYQEP